MEGGEAYALFQDYELKGSCIAGPLCLKSLNSEKRCWNTERPEAPGTACFSFGNLPPGFIEPEWRQEINSVSQENKHKGEHPMAIDVVAPMPGTIVEIVVKVGDVVKEDDDLVILEAMKMENPIVAVANGTVKAIMVKEKDKVKANQVLVVLE